MRVAFTVFGGESWTGGGNYLRNMLEAINELSSHDIDVILFQSGDADQSLVQSLLPFLAAPPVIVNEWNKGRLSLFNKVYRFEIFRNKIAEEYFRREKVDVVFQHGAWYGLRFSIPTLAWIPDFQHKHLPSMFSFMNKMKRNIGYTGLSCSATRILVSSEDARKDCERFYPVAKNKISVLPFCVKPSLFDVDYDYKSLRERYNLPGKYFYLPNQFWKHKNHLAVVSALSLLQEQGREDIIVAVSGSPKDFRNPEYPDQVFAEVRSRGLLNNFRFLGMIPYHDIKPLMRGSLAVINPSFFEGWSTTVEEAKSLGVDLVLSDIAVHKEQTCGAAEYFEPDNSRKLAEILSRKFEEDPVSGARQERERSAELIYTESRKAFSLKLYSILQATINDFK